MRYFAACCVSLLLVLQSASAYNDVENYAWKNSINFLTEQGHVRGYDDNTFRPTTKINRAEFVKIIVTSQFKEVNVGQKSDACFSDVPPQEWYAPYVCFAKERGIVSGNPDGTFRPASFINQAEALKILLLTFNQPLSVTGEPWYRQYFDTAKNIGMLYFAAGNEAAYPITRGEMAYFTAWLLSENAKPDQLQSIEQYVAPFAHTLEGSTHVVTMDTLRVRMRIMTGNDSIRPKECDFPHHCVAESQAESFESFIARSGKGLVVNGTFFDAYSKPADGKNFHQVSSDIVIAGIMKSMYGWDNAFGDGGMLAQLKNGSFAFFYPVREWLKSSVDMGISNYPLVLREGNERTREEIGVHAANDAGFWQALRRGGLGLSKDGKQIYYVSVQGTVSDLGVALKKAGAWNGFALDSGSSNAFFLEGKTLFKPGRRLPTVIEFYQ